MKYALKRKLTGKHVLMPKRNGSKWLMNEHEEGTYWVIEAAEGGNAVLVLCAKQPHCRHLERSEHER